MGRKVVCKLHHIEQRRKQLTKAPLDSITDQAVRYLQRKPKTECKLKLKQLLLLWHDWKLKRNKLVVKG
jgi:hypothetical protein